MKVEYNEGQGPHGRFAEVIAAIQALQLPSNYWLNVFSDEMYLNSKEASGYGTVVGFTCEDGSMRIHRGDLHSGFEGDDKGKRLNKDMAAQIAAYIARARLEI